MSDSIVDYDELTVVQLRELCRLRGLATYGNRSDLVRRLRRSDQRDVPTPVKPSTSIVPEKDRSFPLGAFVGGAAVGLAGYAAYRYYKMGDINDAFSRFNRQVGIWFNGYNPSISVRTTAPRVPWGEGAITQIPQAARSGRYTEQMSV